jgi:general secretion pathway protein H
MPTSVTGTSDRARVSRPQRGFTLLELLVVVAIIGLLVQAVTLSMNALGNDRELEQEADRLGSLIDLLNEEALMQSRDYGLMFTQTGYRFYIYDYLQMKWAEPQNDRLLARYALRPQLKMALLLDGREVPLEPDFESRDIENAEPQVMLLASGELTPFTVEMARDGSDGRFELTAALDGTVKIAEEGFD